MSLKEKKISFVHQIASITPPKGVRGSGPRYLGDKTSYFLEALVASDTHPEKVVDYVDKMTVSSSASAEEEVDKQERRLLGLKVLTFYCRSGLINQGQAFRDAWAQKFGTVLSGGSRDVDLMALNMVNLATDKEEMRQIFKNIFALDLVPRTEAVVGAMPVLLKDER